MIEKLPSIKAPKNKQAAAARVAFIREVFYSAANGYDFQYLESISQLYQFDKAYLKAKGFRLDQVVAIFAAIKFVAESLPAKQTDCDFDQFVFSTNLILSRAQKFNQGVKITKADVDKLLDFFIARPGEQNLDLKSIGDFSIVNFKPIIKIADQNYFILSTFHLAKAMYDSLSHWLATDKDYVKIADKNRMAASRALSYQYLKRVFKDMTFKDIKVKQGQQLISTIDVMGLVGNVAVIIENQSLRPVPVSDLSYGDYVKTDFIQTMQAALNQAAKSRQAILDSENYQFIDANDQPISLPSDIDEVYVMCLTTEFYAEPFLDVIEYFRQNAVKPWPVIFNLIYLDMLTEYLSSPYDFIFYLQQRSALEYRMDLDVETCLIPQYLHSYSIKLIVTGKVVIVPELLEIFNTDYMFRRGWCKRPAGQHYFMDRDSNEIYDCMIKELEIGLQAQPKLTDIMLFLKSLMPAEIDEFLGKMCKDVLLFHQQAQVGQQASKISDIYKKQRGVCYVIDTDVDRMEAQLVALIKDKRQRSKIDNWLGIGSLASSSGIVDCLLFTWRTKSGVMKRRFFKLERPRKSIGLPKQIQILGQAFAELSGDSRKVYKPQAKAKKKRLRKLKRKAQRKNRRKR